MRASFLLMNNIPTHEITELLLAWNRGERHALDRLIPLVDVELRKIAHAYMKKEKPGHTLQTTALVNEALLKLLGEEVSWTSRKHFYALVARRMRQILTDYARVRLAEKRGSEVVHVNIDDVVGLSVELAQEVVLLDAALTKLSAIDERKTRVVEYRYFGGFTLEEVAEILDVAPSTVEREWRQARSWLKREMS
jgi:RNA polymerase sigma-70 factor (ECF subfamily)